MLAAETGRPLVQHVVDRVRRCRLVDEVIVAADDERIAAALAPFGTKVVLTSRDHPSGTDRVAEVARGLAAPDTASATREAVAPAPPPEIIVNVQGDEPEIDPGAVDALIELMRRTPSADMATLATPFPQDQDPASPDLVKVVVGRDGRALYFSRSPIPYHRDTNSAGMRPLLHIGLYGYRRAFLLELAEYAPTPLEETEKLEQLRVLEYGHTIVVAVVDHPTHGIDTAAQYAEFVKRERARIAERSQEPGAAAETRVPSQT